MSEIHPVDRFESAAAIQFSRDLMGDEMAHLMSRITINWGRVEHALYISMRSIDPAKALEWTAKFFLPANIKEQKKKVRLTLDQVVGNSGQHLPEALEEALTDLVDLQMRRNAVSHGLWLPHDAPDTYTVHPLRYDKDTVSFDQPLVVDHIFLGKMLQDMEMFWNRIFSIGANQMARQQLNKWENPPGRLA